MNSPGGNREKDQRLYGVGGLLFVGMGILLAGLWYVQVVTALNYVQDQETQSMRTVRIPAVRGSILDANGRPLAYDRPTYVVNAYLEELRHHFRQEWKRNRSKGTMTREDRGALEIAVRYLVVSNFTAQLNLDLPIDVTPRKMQAHFLGQRALPQDHGVVGPFDFRAACLGHCHAHLIGVGRIRRGRHLQEPVYISIFSRHRRA